MELMQVERSAWNGILFNHESTIRGETFITRNVIRSVASIEYGTEEDFPRKCRSRSRLGRVRDFVDRIRLMLQLNKPDEYVLATRREPFGARVCKAFPPLSAERSYGAEMASRRDSTGRAGRYWSNWTYAISRRQKSIPWSAASKASGSLSWQHRRVSALVKEGDRRHVGDRNRTQAPKTSRLNGGAAI
jgi:GDP-D-mannose dehydratase